MTPPSALTRPGACSRGESGDGRGRGDRGSGDSGTPPRRGRSGRGGASDKDARARGERQPPLAAGPAGADEGRRWAPRPRRSRGAATRRRALTVANSAPPLHFVFFVKREACVFRAHWTGPLRCGCRMWRAWPAAAVASPCPRRWVDRPRAAGGGNGRGGAVATGCRSPEATQYVGEGQGHLVVPAARGAAVGGPTATHPATRQDESARVRLQGRCNADTGDFAGVWAGASEARGCSEGC